MSKKPSLRLVASSNSDADQAVTPSRILQIGTSFWSSKVLLTAVEMGLFTTLAGISLTAPELGEALYLHPRGTYDFFDALVALGFLDRDGDGPDGQYHNMPETDQFLDKGKPSYIGGILEMFNARTYGSWSHLGEGLRTGEPQNELKQSHASFFENLYQTPVALESFMDAMTGISTGNIDTFADRFDGARYATLCDVGGATGQLAIRMAEAHPHLRCTTLDLPAVAPIAQKHIDAAGLADRVAVVSSDFLVDDLPNADLITMSLVLHDWNLETKKLLVRKAYDALPEGGAFVVIENLIDDARRTNAFGLMMSLQMLLEIGDGFDYTFADFQGWCEEAGFTRFEKLHLAGPASAGIAYK